MNHQWVLGFIESQGCFSIRFSRNKGKLGYQVTADFSIKTSKNNQTTLQKLQEFFGAGHIYQDNSSIVWKVTNNNDTQKIINFLIDMPFVSAIKRKEFENWSQAVFLIKAKQHLTKQGILEIAKLRELMHDKNLWNKQNFCNIRLDIDPCSPYQEKGKLPVGCAICLKE